MLNQEQPFHYSRKLNLHYTSPYLTDSVTQHMMNWLPNSERDYIILCIGTDRSTGDSLGPLVGSLLKDSQLKTFKTYGWLHKPIHAMNLNQYLNTIYQRYSNPFIITIDAALGHRKSVGEVVAGVGPIKPGSALKKNLPLIGHLHLIGIVNLSGFMEHDVLQNTRLSFIIDMAEKIASILLRIDQEIAQQ